MIRVTIWYEYTQESGELRDEFLPAGLTEEQKHGFEESVKKTAEEIKAVYPLGVMGTVAKHLEACADMQITSVNMYMPEYGLPDELLENTDVLIWWAHISHDVIPDTLSAKIVQQVQKGMGFIPLHSAHKSKPFMQLLGTTGCLKWREGDFCRVWTIDPTHPITQGIPESFELEEEEMYGEPFDIPKPDDNLFISWYRGGEVFRSGCTWTRGYGKIFYFQPGHETSPSYQNPHVLKVIENAVRWAMPSVWRKDFECPNNFVKPEDAHIDLHKLDGLILDVDGTLWDSTEEVAKSYNESIKNHSDTGVTVDAAGLKKLFGKPMDEICAAVFPMLSPEEQMKMGEYCFVEENDWLKEHPVPLFANVFDTLKQLSEKVPLFIVSNCQQGYIEILLETTGLSPYVKGHLCYGDTGTSKGKTIQILMEQYQLKQVAYLGDTQGDADACKEVDIPFVYAAYGFGSVEKYARKIDDIRQLL